MTMTPDAAVVVPAVAVALVFASAAVAVFVAAVAIPAAVAIALAVLLASAGSAGMAAILAIAAFVAAVAFAIAIVAQPAAARASAGAGSAAFAVAIVAILASLAFGAAPASADEDNVDVRPLPAPPATSGTAPTGAHEPENEASDMFATMRLGLCGFECERRHSACIDRCTWDMTADEPQRAHCRDDCKARVKECACVCIDQAPDAVASKFLEENEAAIATKCANILHAD